MIAKSCVNYIHAFAGSSSTNLVEPVLAIFLVIFCDFVLSGILFLMALLYIFDYVHSR